MKTGSVSAPLPVRLVSDESASFKWDRLQSVMEQWSSELLPTHSQTPLEDRLSTNLSYIMCLCNRRRRSASDLTISKKNTCSQRTNLGESLSRRENEEDVTSRRRRSSVLNRLSRRLWERRPRTRRRREQKSSNATNTKTQISRGGERGPELYWCLLCSFSFMFLGGEVILLWYFWSLPAENVNTSAIIPTSTDFL